MRRARFDGLEGPDWDPELLDLRRCLPRTATHPPSAFPAGDPIGARIRIAATVGDQQAALLGVGCSRRGNGNQLRHWSLRCAEYGRRPVRIRGS
jgi:glycerol kinase